MPILNSARYPNGGIKKSVGKRKVWISLDKPRLETFEYCEIIENIDIGLCPGFPAQGSPNSYNFLSAMSLKH